MFQPNQEICGENENFLHPDHVSTSDSDHLLIFGYGNRERNTIVKFNAGCSNRSRFCHQSIDRTSTSREFIGFQDPSLNLSIFDRGSNSDEFLSSGNVDEFGVSECHEPCAGLCSIVHNSASRLPPSPLPPPPTASNRLSTLTI